MSKLFPLDGKWVLLIPQWSPERQVIYLTGDFDEDTEIPLDNNGVSRLGI